MQSRLIGDIDEFEVEGFRLIVGGTYSFRTSPYSEFAPPETNRFAALKILGRGDDHAFYVVLNGIFNKHPTADEVDRLGILRCKRFPHPRLGNLKPTAVSGSFLNEEISLQEFRFVTRVDVSAGELCLVDWYTGTGSWSGASIEAEGEWRWKHDRKVLVEEIERYKEAQAAEVAAEHAKLANRLKGLTWEKLLAETPFENWGEVSGLPSSEFTAAARGKIHATIAELRLLGSKPRKAVVRSALRACVEWFNVADEKYGGVIETVERDDIVAALSEIAYVAGHKSLANEIDNWREW